MILPELSSTVCHCANSPFKDQYHFHITIVDLRIISLKKKKKFLLKVEGIENVRRFLLSKGKHLSY